MEAAQPAQTWHTPACPGSQGRAGGSKGYDTASAWRRWPRWDWAELQYPYGHTSISLRTEEVSMADSCPVTNTSCRPQTLRERAELPLPGHVPSSGPAKRARSSFSLPRLPPRRPASGGVGISAELGHSGRSPGPAPAAQLRSGLRTGGIRAPQSRRPAEHHPHRGPAAWKRAFIHPREALPARRGWINGV